jgi:subtilisin family serine protease
LGEELPDSVTTKFYGSGDDIYGSEHGTACAEIIYDIAPDAQFFLTQPRTEVELGNAVNWCISQGVNVISYSMGWHITAGPLDGTGVINGIVNNAVNYGIAWVNSAGNYAKAHWGGDFYDPDGDGFHNFSGSVEVNGFETWGESVIIGMIWDDPWGFSNNDYDLYVYRLDTLTIVALSVDPQDGDDDPIEYIKFIPIQSVPYAFVIKKYRGLPKNIHVNFLTKNALDYQVPATSILIPADNPNVITVGAVAWNTPSVIENFSSQGPTTDGRIKPDLVAPDSVSTESYGATPFSGTSASCPHVAGACALVKQAYPSWSPSQIKGFLESNAIDLGTAGKDNIYGSGRVWLPSIGPVVNLKAMPWLMLLLGD